MAFRQNAFPSTIAGAVLIGSLLVRSAAPTPLDAQEGQPRDLVVPEWQPVRLDSLPVDLARAFLAPPFLNYGKLDVAPVAVGLPSVYLVRGTIGSGTGVRIDAAYVVFSNGPHPPMVLWGGVVKRIWRETDARLAGRWDGCVYVARDSAIAYVFLRTGGYSRDPKLFSGEKWIPKSGYYRFDRSRRLPSFTFVGAVDASIVARCKGEAENRANEEGDSE